MNKCFLFLVGLFISCSQIDISAVEMNDISSGKAARGFDIKESEKMKLSVDLEEEKKLQLAVDRGHQPWRLLPIDVAYAALLANNIGGDILHENCSLVSEADNVAIVKCRGARSYIVHLKRLVKPGGIWTATDIDKINRDND